MDKEILKYLILFYSKLETIENKRAERQAAIKSPLNAMRNFMEQLKHITSVEVNNAELFNIEGFRDRLIFKIHEGLEKEIQTIQDVVYKMNNDSEDLNSRLRKLEEARSKVSLEDPNMEQLVIGTPERPKLDLLMQWAIDVCNHYRDLYHRVKKSLIGLNYHDEDTLDLLCESFVEKESSRDMINNIIAYTQFLARETC